MKEFYRVILGRKNANAAQCVSEGFVGIDYDMPDMTAWLSLDAEGFDARVREELQTKSFCDTKIRKVSLAGSSRSW